MDQLNSDENAKIKCINREIFDCSVVTIWKKKGKPKFFERAIDKLLSVDGFLNYMRF